MNLLESSFRSDGRTRLRGIAAFFAVAAVATAGAQFVGPADATFKGEPGLLAFNDDRVADCDTILLARPSLTQPRPLTLGSQASFSPEGEKLIYRGCGRRSDIWEVNVDGSNPHLLISGSANEVMSPSYSPDGRRIVYLKDPGLSSEGRRYDVWTARADGSGERRLTRTADFDRAPTWSPNGRYIVFGRLPYLWTMRPDGSRAHRLTRGREADVSPDGRLIVFARSVSRNKGIFSQICVVRPGGRKIRVVTQFDGIKFWVGSPVFSPQGNKLRYLRDSYSDLDRADVWAVKLNGQGNHRVRRTPLDEDHLEWQAR